MQENLKILSLYQSLSLKERNRLTKFIASPYYNESAILIKMNEYICNFMKDDNMEELNTRKLFTHVYGKKKFNIGLLRYFLTRLNYLVEQFIGIQYSHDHENLVGQCRFYKERNLSNFYEPSIKKLEQNLQKKQISNYAELAKYTDAQTLIGESKFNNLNTYIKFIHKEAEHYEKEVDSFLILSKLKQICAAKNFEMISGISRSVFLEDSIIEELQSADTFKKNILVSAYYMIYQTFSHQEVGIESLLEFIGKHKSEIEILELKDILSYAQNYCLRQINKGNIEFQQMLLRIYKLSLDAEVMIENKSLSESNYKNVIFLGLRLKEFDWTLHFLKKYIVYLPKDKRVNALNFNMARYHFFQKDYDNALVSLREVELNDTFYGLDARSLLLKTYFEKREGEAFYNLILSFKTFLKRKKLVSAQHQLAYSNMIKSAKKIYNINLKTKKELKSLADEIQALHPCADKGWLSEKLNDLEKGIISKQKK